MKKTLLTIAVVAMATASFGWIDVTWDSYRLYDYTGSPAISTMNPETAKIVWQLYYTAKTAVEDPTLDTATGEVKADYDTLLATRVWDPNVATNTMSLTQLQNGAYEDSTINFNPVKSTIKGSGAEYKDDVFNGSAGSVYAAVFQYVDNAKTGATDVYFAKTALLNNPENWSADSGKPAPFAASVGGVWDDEGVVIGTHLGSIAGVPEPATMSLLGLGALAMVIRRKLRK